MLNFLVATYGSDKCSKKMKIKIQRKRIKMLRAKTKITVTLQISFV